MDAVRTTKDTYPEHPYSLAEWGAELGIASVLFVRAGIAGGALRGFTRHTSGIGVGLPLGRYGGMRWDRAAVASGLTDERWSFWVDPFAFARRRDAR